MAASNTQFKVENGLKVVGQANVSGNLEVAGDLTVQGSLISSGTAAGDIVPTNNTYNIGNTSNRWNVYAANAFVSDTITVSGQLVINNASAANLVAYINNTPLGTTTARWALFANTVDFLSGNVSSNVWITSTPATFNALTGVANTTDYITSTSAHGFSTGEAVQYIVSTGNTAVSGLSNGTIYFVVGANSTAFQLATTYGGANINLTAGVSQTGHTLLPVRVSISNTGVYASPVGTVNVGTLRVLGTATVNGATSVANVTINGITTVAGNVAVDTDLLFLDVVNNLIGLKNTAPSASDLVTITGNVLFNTVNTAIRFNTTNASINAYMSFAGNTTVGKLTFAAFDTSNSTVQTGGYVFNGVNSTTTQTLLAFNNGAFQYKGGNVATTATFGVYDVNGTRVGP
jgi:hypothetical protein